MEQMKSKYKDQREPAKPSPEVNDARQKIADDLADYVDGHRTDQSFDTGTIRPLLDAARVLAFSAAVNDQDGSPVLNSKAAANTLTTLIRPFCDGPDLQDVVMDAVDRYLETYPEPETSADDGTPTVFEMDQAQAVMDEMTRMTEPLEEVIDALSPIVKPPKYGILNDKLNNEILRGYHKKSYIDGQLSFLWDVNEAGQKETKESPVLFSTTYMGPEIKTSTELTPEDMADLDAITTIIINLIMQGKEAPWNLSPDDIWRKENGISDTKITPTPKQLKDTRARIDMRRFTDTRIDCTAEVRNHDLRFKDERLKDGLIKDNFYHASEGLFRTEKGRIIDGYSFYTLPVVAAYNFEKGNILLAEFDLLDTHDTVKNVGNTGRFERFRRYLLQQVLLMYGHKRDSTRILYDTVYRETSTQRPSDKKQAKDDRDKMMAIMASWKKKHFIRNADQFKKGRSYAGIEVTLDPDYQTTNADDYFKN